MDYSQISNESESSPWNSSPRQSAQYRVSEDATPSKTSNLQQSSDSLEQRDPENLPPAHIDPSTQQEEQPSNGFEEQSRPAQAQQQPSYRQVQGPTYSSYESQRATPYRQQGAPQQQPQQQPSQQRQQGPPQRQAPQWNLNMKITGLERLGKKDVIIRFDAQTNLPRFRTTQFRDIRRTHGEFKKFAEHLIASNPEAIVPAVPFAVTSAGAGTEEDEARVKGFLQKWLNTVSSNPVLARDDEMIFFIESDFGYSPVVRMRQPATGARRKYLKQFAPPPDDTPELFSARPTVKAFYLGAMETGQKVDKLVKARKGLGLSESELGNKISQMHVQEIHPGLATAYRKLGRTIQAIGDFHAAQGTAEATTLSDVLNYHSEDALIVKETLTNRHILLRELLQAQATTRSRLGATDRLKASSSVRRDKVDDALASLEEARAIEQALDAKTQRVTQNLVYEKRRWFYRTTADMRVALKEYVLRQIDAERRALATLEIIRPDIRAIDASGGLSRLGRDAQMLRRGVAPSQGPKGDAWSGVQRTRTGSLRNSIVGPEDLTGAGTATEGDAGGREAAIAAAKIKSSAGGKENEDEDRVDARTAASKLATSTF